MILEPPVITTVENSTHTLLPSGNHMFVVSELQSMDFPIFNSHFNLQKSSCEQSLKRLGNNLVKSKMVFKGLSVTFQVASNLMGCISIWLVIKANFKGR